MIVNFCYFMAKLLCLLTLLILYVKMVSLWKCTFGRLEMHGSGLALTFFSCFY